MSLEGRLSRERFGHNMPVDAPIFAKPPIYYRNAESFTITYETDEEAALDMLPEGLELQRPATAALLFLSYPFSTLGPYEETILAIPCLWEGQPRTYIPHIVVNSDIPMAAGREVWGFPKKMADITYRMDGDILVGIMERPKGNRICTVTMRPEIPFEPKEAPSAPGVALRVIPSPEENAPPSLAELVEVQSTFTTLEMWQGPGTAQYNSESMIDPWHRLSVKKILVATYRRYHSVLGYGKIIKKY
jgi:acetoacetate decarboxylase